MRCFERPSVILRFVRRIIFLSLRFFIVTFLSWRAGSYSSDFSGVRWSSAFCGLSSCRPDLIRYSFQFHSAFRIYPVLIRYLFLFSTL